MKIQNNFSHSGALVKIVLLLLTVTYNLDGQEINYPYCYRIYFRDKGENAISAYSATDLLSERAIQRRNKAGIMVPDYKDIPVNGNYLKRIASSGLIFHTSSKWMNTALFKSQSLFDINSFLELPFVSDVIIVKRPGKKSQYNDKLCFQESQGDLPPYSRPLAMINGIPMHNSGYTGKNILIAILDGGFQNADEISSLNNLRARKGIKSTYDFVKKTGSVYNSSTHGTAVLSILAGQISGKIEGTAPGADYLLLKTEDVGSEFPCEEDFWVAGAEYADSTGADIISSSLGYFTFDDPSLNYKPTDLNGNTAFITIAADIAASKGILVVNSAGNERNKDWQKIIFPSDGDNVLSVGAVDGSNIISAFSSAGPSSDRRVKPDNAAMGVNVPVQTSGTEVFRSNGTSFSCPVLSGISACMMQAVPSATCNDIISVLHSSADRYNFPDSLYGYGIPDIVEALATLQKKYVSVPESSVLIFPNPTAGSFEIDFTGPPENFTLEIISINGKSLYKKSFIGYAGRAVTITDLIHSEPGIYFLKISVSSGIIVRKIFKVKN
jgi:serine protease AprX